MNRLRIVIVSVTTLLITSAVVVALHERQPIPLSEVPVTQTPAEVRVKAVERKTETVKRENVTASGAVAIVCGADKSLRGSDPIDPCLNDYLVDFSFFFVYNTQGKAHIKLWRLNE